MKESLLPTTQVSVLACDRVVLLARALKSVAEQRTRAAFSSLNVDVKSVHSEVQLQLEESKKGESTTVHRVEYKDEARVRNHCLAHAVSENIELQMWLDDDDVFGSGFVACMQREWLVQGKPDILVPGEWAREWGLGGTIEQFHSEVPPELTDFEGWAKLFQIGAACAISVDAYKKFGGFCEGKQSDPWVRMFYEWVLKGATVRIASIGFEQSYTWLHHNPGTDNTEHTRRRQIYSRTRTSVVKEVYECFMAAHAPAFIAPSSALMA